MEPTVPPEKGPPEEGPPERPLERPLERMVYSAIIVKPFRVEPVLRALRPFRLRSLSTTEVRGYGRQKGHLELYKGSEYAISFIPKVKVEVVLPASQWEEMAQAVAAAARTGRIGDGKVFRQSSEVIDLEPD